MKKIILANLLSIFTLSFALGQSPEPKQNRVYRPDIPGSFKIDFGFNVAVNRPPETDFQTSFFPTNSLNLYYQYPFRFGKSNFSVNPGIGVSFERFKFTNGVIIVRQPNNRYEFEQASAQTQFSNDIKKTILSARYVDMPLEFRFDTKPEDLAHSFNFALGGRIGYLIDAMNKVKYVKTYSANDSEKITNKDKQNLGLTKFRYGVYTRFGIGAFNLFFFYNLSPTFQPGIGPERTEMNTFTTGISINGF